MTELNKHFTARKTTLEQLPLVQEQNEQVVTTSLIVAEEFEKEHRNVLRNIEGLLKNEHTHKMFQKSTYIHKQNKQEYSMYYMNRDGFTLLAMGFTGKKAMQFKLKFIEQFNRMEQYIKEKEKQRSEGGRIETFEMSLLGAKYLTEMLRMDDSSTLEMVTELHDDYNLPTKHLPNYVEGKQTLSLTELLKRHNSTMSAIKANNKLIRLGLLEIKERPSTSGTKEFKSITDKGLRYGKNLVSPRNKRETQPHYYVDTFPELLGLLESLE